jgi:hypothetical protein
LKPYTTNDLQGGDGGKNSPNSGSEMPDSPQYELAKSATQFAQRQEAEEAFRRKQLEAEKQRLQHENTAAIAGLAEDHVDLLYTAGESAVQKSSFDVDMVRDDNPIQDIDKKWDIIMEAASIFGVRLDPQPLASEIPLALSKQITDYKPMDEARRAGLTIEEMEECMAQPLLKPSSWKETERLPSLGPYMGPHTHDSFSTLFTPRDFIHFKEAQQPWSHHHAADDLPPPIFFCAKCAPPCPSPTFAENFEDQVENILQSLADMPKAEPVLTMGELRARRLRRGLKWAHMQRERQ